MMIGDWLAGFAGGLMIGGAAALYLLMNGKIMGASGIFAGLLAGPKVSGQAERLAFVATLVLVPAAYAIATGGYITHLTTNPWLLIAAGLLTGFGTRLANGCTSGHGVCGISRLAPRGIVATLVYILSGMATLFVMRHLLGVV